MRVILGSFKKSKTRNSIEYPPRLGEYDKAGEASTETEGGLS